MLNFNFDQGISVYQLSVGRWMSALRVVRRLSAEDLAARAGIEAERIIEIETGSGRAAGIDELGRLLAALDPALLQHLVEFASSLGAASNSIDDACDLSRLASRLVAAFGVVPSTATRDAVADLVETIAGCSHRQYHS